MKTDKKIRLLAVLSMMMTSKDTEVTKIAEAKAIQVINSIEV